MAFGEISIREYKLRFTENGRFVQTDDFDLSNGYVGKNRDFICQMIREALDYGNILIEQFKRMKFDVPEIEIVAFDLSGNEVFCKKIVNR
jgi:hypothetical protein